MKHVNIILGAVFCVACGSRDVPPASSAASSTSVENATDSPNTGPDFTPASQDGTFQTPSKDARDANGSGDQARAPGANTTQGSGATQAESATPGSASTP